MFMIDGASFYRKSQGFWERQSRPPGTAQPYTNTTKGVPLSTDMCYPMVLFWYQMQEVYCEANHIPGSARPEPRDADARPRPQRRVFGLHGTRLRARQHTRHRYPR